MIIRTEVYNKEAEMLNSETFIAEQERLGTRLRFLRRNAGVGQRELADVVGITFQQLQKYERGQGRLPALYLRDFAEFLGQPMDAFFPASEEGVVDEPGSLTVTTMGPKETREFLAILAKLLPAQRRALRRLVTSMIPLKNL